MTRHHAFFSPYFTSNEFQESDERKMEKTIEDKWKYIVLLITKVWKKPKHKPTLKKAIQKIINEDQELLDRLKKFD
jgi:hypothetical protein